MQIVRAFRFGPEAEEGLFVHAAVRHRVHGFRATEIEQNSGKIEDEGADFHFVFAEP